MPITRTAMIDDDGSGTTGTILNNAWKQEIYNQIDAMAVAGTWAPVDGSGAGLVFTVTAARYWKFDKLVVISAQFSYPATANGAQAIIGGLPFPNGAAPGGLYTTNSTQHGLLMGASATVCYVMTGASGAGRSNGQVSGQSFTIAGSYITA